MKLRRSIVPVVVLALLALGGCRSGSNTANQGGSLNGAGGAKGTGSGTFPAGGGGQMVTTSAPGSSSGGRAAGGGQIAISPDAGVAVGDAGPVVLDAGHSDSATAGFGGTADSGTPIGTGGAATGTGRAPGTGGASASGGLAAGGGLGGATAKSSGGTLRGGGATAYGGVGGMSGGGGAAPSGGTGGPTTAGSGTRSSGGVSPPGGGTDSGGRAGSAGGATASNGTGSSGPASNTPCTVTIAPLSWSASSLLNLVSGSTATLAVEGAIAWGSSTPTTPSWQWTVKGPDGTPLTVTPLSSTNPSTSDIQFPVLTPGGYDISVSATSSCTGHTSATAVKPQERSPQPYFIRILPPPDDSGQTCTKDSSRWCPSQDAVPYEDTSFMLQPGQPRQDDIQFVHGYVVSIDPADPTASPAVAVPSVVRVSPQGSTWTFDGATNDQPLRALLHPLLRYDILVVPGASSRFPPFLVASKLAQEFRPEDFYMAVGVTLQGTLRGPGGPVAGRLSLRADPISPVTLPLPSTVGVAATGAYSLQASAGALFSAVVMPPSNSSLPQVTVTIPNSIDLQTMADGTSLAPVNFTWNAISTTTMTLRVLASDNTTPAASTSVRLQSQDGALPNAGVFTVAGSAVGTASGSLRKDGTTDANGSIVFSNIPKIAYQLTAVPPSSLAGSAITTASIDLAGVDTSVTRSLNLGRKVILSGHLSPADATGGAHLVVTDTGTDVLATSISATVASDGSYQFLADPFRTYGFSVEPVAGKNLPTRIPIYVISTTDQDRQVPDHALPSGLKISGTVSFGGAPVAGAIVQAYCEQSGIVGCVDPNNPSAPLPSPLVEFATLPGGSYSFYLLDPATGG